MLTTRPCVVDLDWPAHGVPMRTLTCTAASWRAGGLYAAAGLHADARLLMPLNDLSSLLAESRNLAELSATGG
jgi:hypothetical protein